MSFAQMLPAIKLKAVCIILLLVGHEAARVNTQMKVTKGMREARAQFEHASASPKSEAEKEFHTANKECNWQWTGLSCTGAGCKYRPLPLDVMYSQSCRMSDEAMLNDTKKFYGIQSGLLLAKATKFAEDCDSVNFFNLRASLRCKRRAQHMMRATTFMTKASILNKTKDFPQEELKSANEAMSQSLEIISGAIGESGPDVIELVSKVKKSATLREDWQGTMKNTTKILWDLLMGDEQAKRAARIRMERMVEADAMAPLKVPKDEPGSPTAADAAAELEKTTDFLENLDPDDDVVSSLMQLMPSHTQNQNSADLLDEDAQVAGILGMIEKFMTFIVVFLLVLVLVMLGTSEITATFVATPMVLGLWGCMQIILSLMMTNEIVNGNGEAGAGAKTVFALGKINADRRQYRHNSNS